MSRIDPNSLPTDTFDWGHTTWLVSPEHTPGAVMTFGEVLLMPGHGHERHNHPGTEEILYFLSGEGMQTVDDGQPFPVRAGDCVFIPTGAFHATVNTGWQPVRVLAVYNPGGAEVALRDLPDYRRYGPGEPPRQVRSE